MKLNERQNVDELENRCIEKKTSILVNNMELLEKGLNFYIIFNNCLKYVLQFFGFVSRKIPGILYLFMLNISACNNTKQLSA